MIRVRLQIGNEEVKDTYDAYGLIYLSSDNIFSAPTKGFEKTAYAEQAGENIDPRTVDDAFDYTARFLVNCPNGKIENANKKIADFNSLMFYKTGGDDIKGFREFKFYNDYKKVKIVGYPEPIAEAKEFWRDKNGNVYDIVQVELKIRVSDPRKCDFNINSGEQPPVETHNYLLLENMGKFELGV